MPLGAANRDPAQFADPDRLLLPRPENRHLSIGLGVHFCLEAPLSRVEGEIAFSTLFKRSPHLRLETDVVEWQPSMVFRGLLRLPVNFIERRKSNVAQMSTTREGVKGYRTSFPCLKAESSCPLAVVLPSISFLEVFPCFFTL